MPEVVQTLADAPMGSHTLSLHADQHESAENAAEFVSGAPRGQAVSYWVPDPDTAELCARRFSELTPEHVGCVAILPQEQVELAHGRLRPIPEVRDFLEAHPEGVTAAADTISVYWRPETVPEHLEYEAWFEAQPRRQSRFMCPYDLRMIPAHLAPQVLRDLGAHHSHVMLSRSAETVVQLLQLFVFEGIDDLPPGQREFLDRAGKDGLVTVQEGTGSFGLAPAGEELVARWAEDVTVGETPADHPA